MAKRRAKKKVEEAPAPSGMDMLGMLGDAVPEKKPAKDAHDDRPTIEADTELMVEFAGAHICSKITTERKDLVGAQLKEQVWQHLTDQWFANRTKPSNPKMQIKKGGKVDTSAIFQLKATFKVQSLPLDEANNSARGAVTGAFMAVGFDQETAEQLMDENVEAEMVTELKPFNELIQGKWISGKGGREFVPASDEEKSAAQKLLAVATGASQPEPLTADERAACITKKLVYQVKAGFMERAANYCEDADQLRALLTVVKPQRALSHVKFAAAQSENERNKQVLAAFTEILMGEEAA